MSGPFRLPVSLVRRRHGIKPRRRCSPSLCFEIESEAKALSLLLGEVRAKRVPSVSHYRPGQRKGPLLRVSSSLRPSHPLWTPLLGHLQDTTRSPMPATGYWEVIPGVAGERTRSYFTNRSLLSSVSKTRSAERPTSVVTNTGNEERHHRHRNIRGDFWPGSIPPWDTRNVLD